MFASSQAYKYAKLPNYQLQNIILQSYKLQNCMCMFVNFKFIKLNISQFKIIIITKIASTYLQICKITKITNCKCIFAYL
jgi:hypothetical protein